MDTRQQEQRQLLRDRWLAQFGLCECSDCGSWIYRTRAAAAFHVRRCTG